MKPTGLFLICLSLWGVSNIVGGDTSGCDYGYTEKACRDAAKALGLTLGHSKRVYVHIPYRYGWMGDWKIVKTPFKSSKYTKGCYTYNKGDYKGHVFFGTGGTLAERKAPVTGWAQYRPGGYDDPWLIACAKAAKADAKLKFVSAGDYWTKGCYAYRSGKYKNKVYYGLGGSENDKKSKTLPGDVKYRPTGFDDCKFDDLTKLV